MLYIEAKATSVSHTQTSQSQGKLYQALPSTEISCTSCLWKLLGIPYTGSAEGVLG